MIVGHGGRTSVLVWMTPPGPVIVVITGGTLTLTDGRKVPADCPEVMFML